MKKAFSYIRMSTEIQLRGDSLRRQLEASERYAKEHGLELVDNIDGEPLKDIGVSGFNGVNSKKGVLAKFLAALLSGKIAKGSVLLVESLDRLSRDNLYAALGQFTTIIGAGVEIVTLADGQVYSQSRIENEPGALFMAFGSMLRANDESKTKSLRIGAAWKSKRDTAQLRPLTAMAPLWLRLNKEKGKFEEIPDRVAIVKRIFKMAVECCGVYVTAKTLNQEKVPPFSSKAKYWHITYVTKILANRAVLGEFQPHMVIGDRRVPQGDPIQNYFPQIIDETTFSLAHAAIARRKTTSKGRKGRTYSNLFSGLLYCGRCGSRVSIKDRGPASKGGKTLMCSTRRHGDVKCTAPELKLADFESTIFKHLREVDFAKVLSRDESVQTNLEAEITTLEHLVQETESKINALVENLTESVLNDTVRDIVGERLNRLTSSLEETKRSLALKRLEHTELIEQKREFDPTQLRDLKALIEERNTDFLFRSEVNQTLSRKINRIEIHLKRNEFHPWEFEEDDSTVRQFRAGNDNLNHLSFEEILEHPAFRNFIRNYDHQLVIRYRTGAVRRVFFGPNASMLTTESRGDQS